MKFTILVIDDNPDIAHALQVLFAINHLNCLCAYTPEQGLALLRQEQIDLVIQDMNFTEDTTSGEEGKVLFQSIRQIKPDLPIILLTAWTDLETAIALVKQGAADYLAKPWQDEKLLVTINNLLELASLRQQQKQQLALEQSEQHGLAANHELCGLVFQSRAMTQLLQIATKVAPADVPVLVTGPNGAGKEKIAEIIQANSSCRHGAFIKVNVGALPKELMEAELFGAEAGAYTGAMKRRIGRFELADNGTLFLDEIGNLSLDGQAKLLRVLESGEFERLGGTDTIKVKVRIISATNADLPQAIIDGTFREDLFYRLNLIQLQLPALAQRKDDIPLLVQRFLGTDYQISPDGLTKLMQYPWPGNIRELQNSIKRAKLLCQDKLVSAELFDLPAISSMAASSTTPVTLVKQPVVTKVQIEQAISEADGVISDAAKLLTLSRSALYRRMKKFGIDH